MAAEGGEGTPRCNRSAQKNSGYVTAQDCKNMKLFLLSLKQALNIK